MSRSVGGVNGSAANGKIFILSDDNISCRCAGPETTSASSCSSRRSWSSAPRGSTARRPARSPSGSTPTSPRSTTTSPPRRRCGPPRSTTSSRRLGEDLADLPCLDTDDPDELACGVRRGDPTVRPLRGRASRAQPDHGARGHRGQRPPPLDGRAPRPPDLRGHRAPCGSGSATPASPRRSIPPMVHYVIVGAASLPFVNAPEARLLTGAEPTDAAPGSRPTPTASSPPSCPARPIGADQREPPLRVAAFRHVFELTWPPAAGPVPQR